MMFKLSSALSATLLILSTLMLNGCGETGDLSSTKSVSFNLLSIEVSDSGIATFDWDDSSGASEYIICRKDNTQNNQCEELLTVTSGTTGTVNIGSILEAAVSEYFILAKNEELVALSNKRSIESSELANLITYVKASNTDSSDNFGNSISLSTDGNTLAVGAHYEDSNSTSLNGDQANNSAASSGAVYLFRYKNNQWSQQAYIKAPNAEASDTFGSSVSLSSDGNTLVVGARGEEGGVPGINVNSADNSIPNAGAAYIFTFDGMDWNHQAYVKASNPGDGDHFGTAVALSPDGSTLAVGADEESSDLKGTYALPPTDNNLQSYAGAVYLFRYNGSNWVQEAYIKASNTESGDRFGSSLSLSQDGNTLAVGATGERSNATGVNGEQSNNDLFSSGAVYLFRFDGSSWVQQAYLKASDTSSAGFFGASVSLSSNGNLLGVGGYGQNSSSGAAYVYQFDGSDWSEQAYLTASNAESSDYFGNSVALSPEGNALLVGALFERSNAIGVNGEQTDNSALASGAAYLFRFDGSLWEQEFYIKSSNTEATDRFGLSVSLSSNGSRLVISTVRESSSATGINGDQSDNSASRSGAVYVY
ncbi:FG-GAP repeat protein [Vibrio hepatarius]|uniref:FG-GAP repeat protein n=1 Tax=Vibrio hepatarius TaxID=171383 RepID=UPI00142E8B58|nr:FG-GAP repeat protein [Vibrio hepatarius]NIY82231.1 hypothetical protein [Vibrio hepatarius]